MAKTYGADGTPWITDVVKTTSYQVTNADNGTLFTTFGATGTVTFTLPTLANGVGCIFWFLNAAAQTMAITAPTNKLITFNNLTATTATFSTSANLINAFAMVYMNAAGTFYVTQFYGANTVTIS